MRVLGRANDFRRRIAERELDGNRQSLPAQFARAALQVRPIVFNLLGFGKFQAREIPGDPAVGDVDEQQFEAEAFGQLGHLREQAGISGAVFERGKVFFVHATPEV